MDPSRRRSVVELVVGPAEPALVRPMLVVVTAAVVENVNDVLQGHMASEIEGVDRLYLNAYVPGLQVPGQVARLLHDQSRVHAALAGGEVEDRQPVPTRRSPVR
jgi:hypothetical protein